MYDDVEMRCLRGMRRMKPLRGTTKRSCSVLLCVVGLFLSMNVPQGLASAREETSDEILAVGVAKVASGNLAAAKKQALSQAMEKAAEEYLLLRLGEAGVINNFERIVREILPFLHEGIENFHILAENTGSDEYRVLVKVKVNRSVLDEKLRFSGIHPEQASKGKVLFMVSEVKGGGTQYWWKGADFFSIIHEAEVLLYTVFQERGFTPVNHTFGVAEESLSPAMRTRNLEKKDLLEWGRLLSADYVVTGESAIETDGSFVLQLQVLSVRNGFFLAKGSQAGVDGMTLQEVVRKLADRLIPSMVNLGGGTGAGIQHVQITLRGMRNYREFKAVQDLLKNDIPGIRSVRQSRMSQSAVSVAVDFSGSREQLLRGLLAQQRLPVKLVLERETETELLLRIVH